MSQPPRGAPSPEGGTGLSLRALLGATTSPERSPPTAFTWLNPDLVDRALQWLNNINLKKMLDPKANQPPKHGAVLPEGTAQPSGQAPAPAPVPLALPGLAQPRSPLPAPRPPLRSSRCQTETMGPACLRWWMSHSDSVCTLCCELLSSDSFFSSADSEKDDMMVMMVVVAAAAGPARGC